MYKCVQYNIVNVSFMTVMYSCTSVCVSRTMTVRVYAVFSFFVIQIGSLKTKNEHYIRFSIFYVP